MTNTRIAGPAYHQEHADEVERLAQIHNYAVHIRMIARKASRAAVRAQPQPRRADENVPGLNTAVPPTTSAHLRLPARPGAS